MNLMIISDIHGIKTNIEIIKKKYKENNCNKLIVLGDVFNYWKNIKDFDPEYVKNFLKDFKDELICIKGNCDTNVDFIDNDIKVKDLEYLKINNLDIYFTHGHIYNETNWEEKNTILVFGHYHVPFIIEKENNIFINPGSISLPRNNYEPTYMLFHDNKFEIFDVYDNIINIKDMN